VTKQLLTTRQLAVYLNVSERHLYRQKVAGKLPRPLRIGKCLRWDPQDFEDWGKDDKNNLGRR
jgi:predicted DNA-binding transcriptional regulator AlpA